MPIEHHEHGSTTITGDSIEYFRLAALLVALKAETRGLRMCRGRSAYSIVKQQFGYKGNKAKVLAQLQAKVDELRPQQEHVSTEGGREVREVGGQEVQ